jgi:neutral trehalase
MRRLFEAQWSDGFLPHIVFHPEHLDHFPGPEYWKADRSGRVPSGIHTSGISQPPVHASMLVRALELDSDRGRAEAAMKEFFPKIRALHDYYFQQRDATGEGLAVVVHPWESGLDNAVIWDEPLESMSGESSWAGEMEAKYRSLAQAGERPERNYIRKYSWLVEQLWRRDYDWEAIMAEHPLRVQGLLFNAILCQSERDLSRIAAAIGENPQPHRQRVQNLERAINAKLWSEEKQCFFNYDLNAERFVAVESTFCYMPLYGGVCSQEKAEILAERLQAKGFCIGDEVCGGIPTINRNSLNYEGDNYWRGPIWYNINWFLENGLRRHGARGAADLVRHDMLRLGSKEGFNEYYEPETGKGLGANDFAWSAALFLDFLAAHRMASQENGAA